MILALARSDPLMVDMSAADAGRLLRERRRALGLTQSQVVDLTGLSSQSYLSSFEQGRFHIGRSEHFPAVARVLGLNREEIEALRPGSIVEIAPAPPSPDKVATDTELTRLESEFLMKPVYSLASAGRPVEEMSEVDGISPIPVRRADLRPGTVLFQVQGESMQVGEYGGILPGDVVFVDTQDRDAVPDRVFVIHIPGDGVTLKRVRLLGGALWLFSDNTDQANYPPFQADDARIIGRVHDLTRRPDVRL